jgi:adenylate cyclase
MDTLVLTEENVTFLFTDIEQSTRLAQKLGEDYPGLLFQYRSLVRKAVAETGGNEIDNAGDGFFITYKDVTGAITASIKIQQDLFTANWATLVGLRVRIGIHTGLALCSESGCTGVEVHYASRICDAAHGGQVLLSGATHSMLQDSISDRYSIVNIGPYYFKVPLYQLAFPGGPKRFPKPNINFVGKKIAVMPFVNLTDDSEQEYFCKGITEEIIVSLGKVPGLSVVSRSSVSALRGEYLNAIQVGRKLDTSAILEGSIRKNNGQLRIMVELVNTASGLNIWTGSFESKHEEIFKIQDEISEQVAKALECDLIPHQFHSIRNRQTSSIEAYDFYLRGRRFYNQFSRSGIKLALKMFENAIDADEEYALAYAGMADCYSYLYQHVSPSHENLTKAVESSQKAIDLAPLLADVYVSRGVALTLSQHFEEAENAFRFAIERNPRIFLGWFHYGRMCFTQGRKDKAARMFEEANRVQPDDFQSILLASQAYDDLGSKEQAIAAREKGIKLAKKQLELNPGDTRALYLAANAMAILGDNETSLAWLRRALTIEPDDPMMLYNAGCIYALLGMKNESLNCLEKGVEQGLTLVGWFENDRNLDSVRETPRFQALIKKMGSQTNP